MKVYLFLHVLGAILFLGNIITAAFWKVLADRSGDARTIHRTSKYVMLADYSFTLPGIVLLLTFGHLMAEKAGYELFEWSWLGFSYLLFIISGVIWIFILLPSQHRMIKWSKAGLDSGVIPGEYYRWSRIWNGFGIISVLLPVIVLFLMVVKP
jgi:uncharacterized membrane protein